MYEENPVPDSGNAYATYKLISDPMEQENTAHWGVMACCFNEYAAGETAQAPEQAPEQ